eukprot:scaffold522_cov168-Amphora_coffeaeformis.AAC.18
MPHPTVVCSTRNIPYTIDHRREFSQVPGYLSRVQPSSGLFVVLFTVSPACEAHIPQLIVR